MLERIAKYAKNGLATVFGDGIEPAPALLESASQPENKSSWGGLRIFSDSLINAISGLGTSVDKRNHTHYNMTDAISRFEAESMYRTSWLAKRIVNTIPGDMCREWRDFTNVDGNVLRKAEKRLHARQKLREALCWSRLYGGSIVVMVTDDMDFNDPESTQIPLDLNSLKEGSLRSLIVYDRWRVYGDSQLITDVNSHDFGQPEFYNLTNNAEMTMGIPRVHHSRVLRFDGEKIPYVSWQSNARWHDSTLQHVYDAMINCDIINQGIASMIFESNIDVLMFNGLSETLMQGDEGEKLVAARLQAACMGKSFNKALILDALDKYEKKSNNFSNLDKIALHSCIYVCGAADTPMTRLFGQSAGAFNATGESDIRNYYDMISDKQETEFRPQLEKFDEVLLRSTFGTMPDNYEFQFGSLWQNNGVDESQIKLNNAQADQIYIGVGAITPKIVAENLKESGVYKTLTSKDISAIANVLSNDSDPENSIDKADKKPNKDKTEKVK